MLVGSDLMRCKNTTPDAVQVTMDAEDELLIPSPHLVIARDPDDVKRASKP
jgi:hypothetical protein